MQCNINNVNRKHIPFRHCSEILSSKVLFISNSVKNAAGKVEANLPLKLSLLPFHKVPVALQITQ